MRRTLAVAGALGLLAGVASADVTTEQGASILVWPKVIAAGTRDTIIQIANTSNMMVYAHCFYVNAGLADPSKPFDPIFNPQLWQETDFDIALTRQQPTVWVASTGRKFDPTDSPCTKTNFSCKDAGIDPGLVPQTVQNFTGELKCIETDQFGRPGSDAQFNALPGNHLKGEATLVNTGSRNNGDVAKYNAIGIKADPNGVGAVDNDGILCLGGDGTTAPCTYDPGSGPEYAACPQTWILNHFAEGATDPIAEDTSATSSRVNTELTIVPCTENFETQVPTPVTIQFSVTNEFETAFSASTTVSCWGNFSLQDISNAFTREALQTDYAQTRMRPAGGNGASGFLIVAEEFHAVAIGGSTKTASGAFNPHQEGDRVGPDLITIPAGQHGDNL
ncbi:MAG TPA: hypothetical protein VMW17_06745 [Candidatus Binatia bacterium]|nr:hypothetical protein [Candidatus Binatia bacterium]